MNESPTEAGVKAEMAVRRDDEQAESWALPLSDERNDSHELDNPLGMSGLAAEVVRAVVDAAAAADTT